MNYSISPCKFNKKYSYNYVFISCSKYILVILYILPMFLNLRVAILIRTNSQAGHSCPGMLVFEISASAQTSSNGLLGHIPNPLEIITTGDGCASYWTLYGIDVKAKSI